MALNLCYIELFFSRNSIFPSIHFQNFFTHSEKSPIFLSLSLSLLFDRTARTTEAGNGGFFRWKLGSWLAPIGLNGGWGRGCEVEKGPGGIEADNACRVAISRDTSHHQHINRAPGLSGCAVIFCGCGSA